jgi:integrase
VLRSQAGLETRTARLKLPVARKPVFIRIGPGLSLGYRRNQIAGTWVLRIADGKGGATTRAIGTADDFEEANGATLLDYWQAQGKAKSVARGSDGSDPAKPLTVRRAAEVYLPVLEAKNPRTARDTRGRLNLHFLAEFGDELVTSLTKSKLEVWLNSRVVKSTDREAVRRSKDTANRVLSMVKALLNHALRDPGNRIVDDRAWRLVKPHRGVAVPRAAHFSAEQARALIAATPDKDFAQLLTAGFLTGARYGELTACSVRDFDPVAKTLSVDGKTGPRTVILQPEAAEFFNGISVNRIAGAPYCSVMMAGAGVDLTNNAEWPSRLNARDSTRKQHFMPCDIRTFLVRLRAKFLERHRGQLRDKHPNDRDHLREVVGRKAKGIYRAGRAVACD